ncbi:MAG: hypothetical protein PWQ79_1912 [Thermococcaceae archaeon]|nr:hypothetical protein [Thermococcaceae archaeon]MDK2914997.1 hypothetical protein [Thermococcaceae archaeon]
MKPVELLDANLEAMTTFAFMDLIRLGLELGIFQKIDPEGTSLEALAQMTSVSNKERVKDLLRTYVSLGVLEEEDGLIRPSNFECSFKAQKRDLKKLFPDWISILDELHKMSEYSFISKEHPKILMDFDKGSDFWDMRLMSEPYPTSRRVVSELLKLEDGMRVVDFGCGSVSPVELGALVGPNGKYVGVDFSPGLLTIAETRAREEGLDWVTLREIDIRKAMPKNGYDGVIMSFLLEYFKNPQEIIEKGLETLNPGGKMIIVEPFRENFPLITSMEFFEKLTPEFHRFPSVSSILRFLEDSPHDLKVEQVGRSVLLITLFS